MSRTLGLIAVLLSVVALTLVAVVRPDRRATTFAVPPGTEQTYPAEMLVAGDRFTCHGGGVPVEGPGYGYLSSDGLRQMTASDGSVTIRCPERLAEL